MPNWCNTTYICEGPKKQLMQLYNNIQDCKNGKYNLIKNDRDKRDYFIDLMEHIFKFDFLNDLYNIEYKKDYFESFPDHKKLIDFIKPNY